MKNETIKELKENGIEIISGIIVIGLILTSLTIAYIEQISRL